MNMKRIFAIVGLLALSASMGIAGTVTGTVLDAGCAKSGHVDAECAKNCIANGAPAVVVTADGKVYEVAEQAKVVPHAGTKVKVTGAIEGEKITSIESVEKAG